MSVFERIIEFIIEQYFEFITDIEFNFKDPSIFGKINDDFEDEMHSFINELLEHNELKKHNNLPIGNLLPYKEVLSFYDIIATLTALSSLLSSSSIILFGYPCNIEYKNESIKIFLKSNLESNLINMFVFSDDDVFIFSYTFEKSIFDDFYNNIFEKYSKHRKVRKALNRVNKQED